MVDCQWMCDAFLKGTQLLSALKVIYRVVEEPSDWTSACQCPEKGCLGTGQCLQRPCSVGAWHGLPQECRSRWRQGQGLWTGAGEGVNVYTTVCLFCLFFRMLFLSHTTFPVHELIQIHAMTVNTVISVDPFKCIQMAICYFMIIF